MKITITQEFNTTDDAMEFLARVQGPSPAPAQPPFTINVTPLTAEASQPPAAKKPRKPRADAGQPRGEYKPREGAQQVEGAEHLNAKPGAASAPADTSLPPATPAAVPAGSTPAPQAAAPGEASAAQAASTSAAPAKSSAVEPPQAAQAPAAADLTLEAVRATLGKLNAVPGKGMEACIATLKNFGVLRVSDLPKERYAEFDAYVRAQLPAAK